MARAGRARAQRSTLSIETQHLDATYEMEGRDSMRMDLEAVLAGIVERVRADERFANVRGELTGERRAGRAQIRVYLTANGEERCFEYYVQREAPVHAIVRSMVDDTMRTLPQRIFDVIRGQPQPNDVFYP